jgi:hypothetical protein
MEGEERLYFLTITRGRCLDPHLRAGAWHRIRTRLKQRWPRMEAWTVVEYSKKRAIHIHGVVKRTPGLESDWVEHLADLFQDGTEARLDDVHDPAGLAGYLTKDLTPAKLRGTWQRHFHPVSRTRGWCPKRRAA